MYPQILLRRLSYETMLMLIGSTTTKQGLRIKARLDKNYYASGEKISNLSMSQIKIIPHPVNPSWNYTIGGNAKKRKSTRL